MVYYLMINGEYVNRVIGRNWFTTDDIDFAKKYSLKDAKRLYFKYRDFNVEIFQHANDIGVATKLD